MQITSKSTNIRKKIFDENGIVIVKSLVPKKIIQNCLKDLNNFSKHNLDKNKKHIVLDKYKSLKYIKYFQYLNFYLSSFNSFLNSKILEISSQLLNDKTYFLNMNYHNKIPGGSETPPHQDNFYWCRKPKKALTAYIALNPQSYKNGGISYLLKSHKLKTFDHKSSNVKAFSSYIDNKFLEKVNFFTPVLSVGDVVFHHCNIVHKASKNKHASKERKALAIAIYSYDSKIDKKLLKSYSKNKIRHKKLLQQY
jgi:phytanoyl-CoA hydroxylase